MSHQYKFVLTDPEFKVDAIKAIRAAFGLSLLEAKAVVDGDTILDIETYGAPSLAAVAFDQIKAAHAGFFELNIQRPTIKVALQMKTTRL